jgi:hypothetical protein
VQLQPLTVTYGSYVCTDSKVSCQPLGRCISPSERLWRASEVPGFNAPLAVSLGTHEVRFMRRTDTLTALKHETQDYDSQWNHSPRNSGTCFGRPDVWNFTKRKPQATFVICFVQFRFVSRLRTRKDATTPIPPHVCNLFCYCPMSNRVFATYRGRI